MVSMEEIKRRIYKVLNELGIFVEEIDKDFDMREGIQDSMQYISFIVNLEQEFDIEIPDDMLTFEAIASFDNLAQRICEMISS